MKYVFSLLICVLLFFNNLYCQNTIIFNDVSSHTDFRYFPLINDFCNQSYIVDFNDIKDSKATISIPDTMSNMMCFLYKGKELNLFLNPKSKVVVSLNDVGELTLTGDDAACHETYNSIKELSRRYFYDYFSNLSFSKDVENGKNLEQLVDKAVLDEITLLSDMLRQGGCEEKIYEYYFTDLFGSLVFHLGRSMILGEKTLPYIKELTEKQYINLKTVKGVTSNFAFYEAFYGEEPTVVPAPLYKNAFMNPYLYLNHTPDDVKSYVLQSLLILTYRFTNDYNFLCEKHKQVKDDLTIIYFKNFFESTLK